MTVMPSCPSGSATHAVDIVKKNWSFPYVREEVPAVLLLTKPIHSGTCRLAGRQREWLQWESMPFLAQS